jgi:hypothetical protein
MDGLWRLSGAIAVGFLTTDLGEARRWEDSRVVNLLVTIKYIAVNEPFFGL